MLADGLTLLDDSAIKKTFTGGEDFGTQFPNNASIGKRFELTEKFGDYVAGVYVLSQDGWIPVVGEDIDPHDIAMSVLGEIPEQLDVMRFLVNRTTMIYANFHNAKARVLTPLNSENRLDIVVYKKGSIGSIKLGTIVNHANSQECEIIPEDNMKADYFLQSGDILAVYSSQTKPGLSDLCLTISGSITFA